MFRRVFLSGAVSSLFALLVSPKRLLAQQPPPRQGPGLGPQMRRVGFLLGQWEEEVTYAGREPDASRGRGRWMARPDLGRYLSLRYEARGPEGPYQAMGLLMWDEKQNEYRMWWFDDGGGVGEYRGTFRDEDTLVLEHRGQVDGRDFRERITYTRVTPAEVRTRIEQAYGSEDFKTYLDAIAKRVEGQPQRRPDARPPLP